jgi:4-hydroxybenzoate polyprenyltransferase and related prenyltransferases
LVDKTKYWSNVLNSFVNTSYEKIEKFISFLLKSALSTAIFGSLRTYYPFLLFGAVINWNLLLASFFVIFAVYCMNNLTDKNEDEVNSPEKASFVDNNKKTLTLAVGSSYIIAIILGLLDNIYAVFILLVPLFAGIVYSIQVSPRLPRLKDIFAVKNIIIALSWAIATTFIPAINTPNISWAIIIPIFYFFFVKSFVNSVVCDIRDIEGDTASGIITIPVGIGKEKTKKILSVLTFSIMPVISILLFCGLSFGYFITMAFSMINSYWHINYVSNAENISKYMSFLVQGEWIFVLALCYIIAPL